MSRSITQYRAFQSAMHDHRATFGLSHASWTPVCGEIAVSSAAECSIAVLEAFYIYLNLIEPVMYCPKAQ